MRVYLNPGHDQEHDSGACNADGTREADIAAAIGEKTKKYLEDAGCTVMMRQSDNLCNDSDYDDRQDASVCPEANAWPADIFVSIHCNAANAEARGTEVECYGSGDGETLAQCIQTQIVGSIGTVDRGVKHMPGLEVLKHTDMTAVLVETAFIDQNDDCALLVNRQDDFARAIARGITDYEKATA